MQDREHRAEEVDAGQGETQTAGQSADKPVVTQEEADRVFLALWPDEQARAQAAAQRIQVRGRHVPEDNLHVTLLFIGMLTAERRTTLEAALAQVEGESFEITLDRREVTRRGIAWLGMTEVPPELRRLHAAVSATCEALGIELERRPLRPHMTLARRARPQRPVIIEPISWAVHEFALVRSLRGEEGVRYQNVGRWPLRVRG